MLLASEEHQIAAILESPSAPLLANRLMIALEQVKLAKLRRILEK